MSVGGGKAVGIEWGMMGGTRLSCIDLATGAKVWELKEKSSSSPLVRNGKVVYQTRDNKVQVLDLQTGKPTGTFSAAGDFEMGWLSPWSRFLDPFMLGEKATVASWDKAKKQTVLQSVDLLNGVALDEVRVDGRMLSRPFLAGGHMVCAVEKQDHLVALKVF
jgi:outer membrane protein assembly factor BamB